MTRLTTRIAEGPRGPWLRALAAALTLSAGLIHLAQISVHLAESWMFAVFFVGVGIIQVVAAGLVLLRPWPRIWFVLGIVGSGLTIAIWVVSRTSGLPIGPNPGAAEALGTADAGSSLLEALTIALLALWLIQDSAWIRRGALMAAMASLAFGGLWLLARASGSFDPDPRATTFLPELADRVVAPLVSAVAVSLGLLAGREPLQRHRWWRSSLRSAVVLVFGASLGLALVTLPAQAAQNGDCQYAPIAAEAGFGHEHLPAPIPISRGTSRFLPLLTLVACGPRPVTVDAAVTLNSRSSGATVLDYWLLPAGQAIPQAGINRQRSGAERIGPVQLDAGERRELVVRVVGNGGAFALDSIRLSYRQDGTHGTFGFATFLRLCSPSNCAP